MNCFFDSVIKAVIKLVRIGNQFIVFEQQHKGSTNCCTIWYLCQFFLTVLAFVDNFYGYDVIDDFIQGESIVQNCTGSY